MDDGIVFGVDEDDGHIDVREVVARAVGLVQVVNSPEPKDPPEERGHGYYKQFFFFFFTKKFFLQTYKHWITTQKTFRDKTIHIR